MQPNLILFDKLVIDRIIETMQRRNLHQQQQQQQHHQRAILPTSKPKAPGSLNGSTTNNINHRSNAESSGLFQTWVLVLIIIVLTFIISFFPEQRRMMYDTEQEMEKVVYEAEQLIERDVMEYWLSSKRFYSADSISSDNTIYQADVRMQQQSSKWVDSEKKLKKALQVLVERQEKGLDLGVPVLTRYLGDSIPAFYSKDDASLNMGIKTVEEWNALIEKKYVEMRNEENRWRELVTSTLLSDRG